MLWCFVKTKKLFRCLLWCVLTGVIIFSIENPVIDFCFSFKIGQKLREKKIQTTVLIQYRPSKHFFFFVTKFRTSIRGMSQLLRLQLLIPFKLWARQLKSALVVCWLIRRKARDRAPVQISKQNRKSIS